MDIRKEYVIEARPEDVWAALTNPAVIQRWGGGPAVMAAVPGFKFEFWGGDIHGTVRSVVPVRCIEEEWFGGPWEAPSIARFTLREESRWRTRLELENTGVPDADGPAIDSGWDEFYIGPIKALLEDGGGR